MREKPSHIKNPLTVIALFAGAAEVGGTAVLPWLDGGVQNLYVWFLMVFPTLLVLLFFFVLYNRYQVLYAPSDYRDDSAFVSVLAPRTDVQRVDRIIAEVAEDAGVNIPPDPPTPDIVATINVTESPDEVVATATVQDKAESSEEPHAWPTWAQSLRNFFWVEEIALNSLSLKYDVKWQRNVGPKEQPSLSFDAVATTDTNYIVVEVKYPKSKPIELKGIRNLFNKVEEFYSSLPHSSQLKFKFIYALAYPETNSSAATITRQRVETISSQYRFTTIVEEIPIRDLGDGELPGLQ